MTMALLKRMTGEELLLLRVFRGRTLGREIDAEQDRRAGVGPSRLSTASGLARLGVAGCLPARPAALTASHGIAA